jgi:hypothetical protein
MNRNYDCSYGNLDTSVAGGAVFDAVICGVSQKLRSVLQEKYSKFNFFNEVIFLIKYPTIILS